MITRVVHVRKEPFDRYIGRPCAEFLTSFYGNPFRITRDQTREGVVIAYALYFFSPEQRRLRDLVLEDLSGKTLGCWCAPLWCHGDIIAGYIEWKKKLDNGNGL
jgi:hypothetical protein